MTRLAFDPLIPWALWLPIAIAAVASWGAYLVASRRRLLGRGRWPILALMASGLAAPLIALLNPTWVRELPPPAGKPLLTVLVDRSTSMGTDDAADSATRLAAAQRLAAAIDRDLQTRFDVEVKTFAETPAPSSRDELPGVVPGGDVSDLALAVTNSLTDRPRGQAIWLLSDGVHNAAGGVARLRQAAEQARAMAAPLYVTTFGGPAGVRDLEVTLPVPQEMAFVQQQVSIPVTVAQRGQVGDRATVQLFLDGELVDQRQVGLAPDTSAETTFKVQQTKAGLYRYDVAVPAAPGEVTDLNNRTSLVLRVIDEPVRVLLLEGKPYWDTKFLVRTLALDPSIELHSVVRMTADRYLVRTLARQRADDDEIAGQAGGEAAETAADVARDDAWEIVRGEQHWLDDPKQLGKFQVVILGRNAESFVSDDSLVQLKKWLKQGDGSLVCFRGPPTSQISDRLNELMPIRWTPQTESRFRMQLTSAGQSLRWFSEAESESALTTLPSLARTAAADRPKPLAVVLASASASGIQGASGKRGGEANSGPENSGPKNSGPESGAVAENVSTPVITFQPYGGGRVVVVEGAGMWRWAILPPGGQDPTHVYGELWRSMMRWLVANVGLLPSQRVSLRADKTTFGATESATATLLVRDARDFDNAPRIRLQPRQGDPRFVPATAAGDDLTQFRADFGALPEGRYTAVVEGARGDEVAATTAFDVVGSLRERLDVAARPDLMRMLAEQSGGAVIAGDQPGELLEKFDRHLAAAQPRRLQQTIAWDRWWVLAGLLGLWGTTWTMRRRKGLV